MHAFVGIILFSLLLAGCSSLSREDCVTHDWASIGLADAQRGERAVRSADYLNACESQAASPDHAAYMRGYRKGLLTYCSPESGFDEGRNGYDYKGICPAKSEARFMLGFDRGSALHRIETSIARIQVRLSQIRQQTNPTLGSALKLKSTQKRTRLHQQASELRKELEVLQEARGRALYESDRFLQSQAPEI